MLGDIYLIIEYLGDMDRPAGMALAAQQTVDVGHTTHITEGDHIGAALDDIFHFALAHGRADGRVLDGKEAAEPATLVIAGHVDQLRAFDVGQQGARRLGDAQFA